MSDEESMQDARVELTLVRSDPPCRKCRKAEMVLAKVVAAVGARRVSLRVVTAGDPLARAIGVVMPPMIMVNGKVLCAGVVPREHGLRQLVERECASGGGAQSQSASGAPPR